MHQETGTLPDHFLISSALNVESEHKNTVDWKEKTIRQYHQIDLTQFHEDIHDSQLTSKVCQTDDVEEATRLYNKILKDIIDKHASKIKKYVKININN